jgi:hypothetical protein
MAKTGAPLISLFLVVRSRWKFKKTREKEIKEGMTSALRRSITCIEPLGGGVVPPGNHGCRG